MPTILQNSQIPGAVEHTALDDQESGSDKEIIERNVAAMRDNNSENVLDWSDFNRESLETFNNLKNREDLDSILSGTRTDGYCSDSEAKTSVYESDNSMQRPPIFSSGGPGSRVESNDRVIIPPPCNAYISPNSQVQGVVEQAASWRDDWESGSEKGNGEWNVEGIRDRKSEEVLDWIPADWNWDYIEAYNSSETEDMQRTKYCEDIDSIFSGTNTDGCSENEAISAVYGSYNTVQRPGIFSLENREGHKRNSWGDIGSARRQYMSISGAKSSTSNQHMSSNALSANLSIEDCDGNSHSSLASSPFSRGNSSIVGKSHPTCNVQRCSSTSEANNVEVVHPAPEMILKEAIHHIGHNVADQTAAHISKRGKPSENIISHESLSQHFGRSLDDARKSFGVSRTAFKTMCRDVGIKRWKYGKRNMGRNSSETRTANDKVPGRHLSAGIPPMKDTPILAQASQDLNMMTVKATYNGANIRFKLSDLSGKSELDDNVIKRLHLERNTFTIKYLDDDSEWVLLTCDDDLQECRDILRSTNKTSVRMLILHQPGDHYAP